MSDIDSTSVETDDELLLTFQIEINKYLNSPQKIPLKIVTVGKGSVGKSTLINNILSLQGDNEAKAEWSAKPVTRGVTEYYSVINGVPIYMYDTPGLMDDGIDEKEVIKDIRDQTQGSISLLLYVSSLSNRLNKTDKYIIKVLTEEFTPKIWKHSIVVLSFANEHCQKMDYAKYACDTAMTFQQFLQEQNGCDHYTLRCLHTNDDIGEQYDIPAVPTGRYKDCLPEMWYQILLIVMFRRCHNECLFALMIATSKLLNDTENADAGGIGDVAVGGAAIGGAAIGGGAGTFVALGTGTTAYVTSSTVVASIMTAIGVKTPVAIVTSASLIPTLSTVVSSTALVAGAATGVVGGAVLGIGISCAVLKYIRSRQQT